MSDTNGTTQAAVAELHEYLDRMPEPGKAKRRSRKGSSLAPKSLATAGSLATTGHAAGQGRVKAATPRDGVRRWLTVGMGCGIPCLSLALSSIGGRLWLEGHGVLGGAALVLCCSVLAVSLSHLAWAVRDITRSAWWQSWCLAVAVDCSLVLGELAGISGFSSWVVGAVMVAVTVASAVLNCWAFLRHGR